MKLILDDNRIIIEPDEEKKFSLDKLVSGINKKNLHNEIDFRKRTGAEYW
ncbi:MAG: hypothetical protein V1720_06160 [bacterium]